MLDVTFRNPKMNREKTYKNVLSLNFTEDEKMEVVGYYKYDDNSGYQRYTFHVPLKKDEKIIVEGVLV